MIQRIRNYELGTCLPTGNIRNWILNNKVEFALLLFILLIGAIFRLNRIDEYMIFLGDEGRDAIIVRRLLVDFDPILIGPGTSIGNMYLGPLYYYLIAPALLLAGFSPVGPSIFVALLGVATIFLVWYVTRTLFDVQGRTLYVKFGSLVAALLYAISPTVITYSKSSWNPNVMPFFSLFIILSIWKIWQESKYKWIFVAGISFAFALQSHYLGLLLLPVIFLFYTIKLINLKINGKCVPNEALAKLRKMPAPNRMVLGEIRNFIKYSLISLGIFLFLMSPLLIFDFRHNFINFKAVEKFFSERQTTVSARPWTAIPKMEEIGIQSISSLMGAGDVDLTWIYTYGLFWLTIYILFELIFSNSKFKLFDKKYWQKIFKKLETKKVAGYILLSSWIGISLLGLGLYKQHLYDHYFGFFFTAPFILFGGIVIYIFSKFDKLWKALIIVFCVYAVIINLKHNPLKYPPNRQMLRAEEIAYHIKNHSQGIKFNLAVIAERNYEDGYQYFLEKMGEPVVDIDPLNYQETVAEQLFVVCEMERSKCDPVNSPKSQIANFGWSKIEEEWNVSGITVYKLIHATPTEK